MAKSSDMTRGGANTNAQIRSGLMFPNTSKLFSKKTVNKAATPAPRECPTILSRYLHNIVGHFNNAYVFCLLHLQRMSLNHHPQTSEELYIFHASRI